MESNEDVVRNFVAAWSRLDADEIVAFFTADGTYHNMMNKPVSGRDNLRAFIGGFIRRWSATDWEILNIVSRDNIVIAERVDRSKIGDRGVELPCCGVFEMDGGKIKVWRDYFDLATFTKAFAPSP
jgi:limonene-1,2-epoxide hydrolase